MQSTQYVTLDLNTRSVFSYIRAKQGDSGSRFVCVTLTENGAAYQLPDGVEANFRCLKPDGNSVYNPAVINDDGTITVELTEQVLAVPGVVSSDVCLCDTQGDILSTVSFEIRVDPAPVGTMVASENELLTLLDIIARSEDIVLNMEEINAHIAKTSGNPHKVTAAEVGLGNVPNVATNDQTPTYTQAEEFENLVSGEKLSVSMGKIMKAITVIGGKAPAGYGLGEQAFNAPGNDANQITKCGFFRAYVNTPTGDWWTIQQEDLYGDGLYMIQKASCYAYTHALHAERMVINGSFYEWEWVNPPMIPGVEYRTTERWNGKPVYTMLINCGIMPTAGGTNKIDMPSTINGWIDRVLSANGTDSSGDTIPYSWLGEYITEVSASRSAIYIYAKDDYSANTADVQIRYTRR